MVLEQTLLVSSEIPDDPDVDEEYDGDKEWMPAMGPFLGRSAVDEFVNFDRDEKGRFANGHPTGPTYPEHQADPFHQREETVDECAGRRPENIGLRNAADSPCQISPELSFRVQTEVVQQILEVGRQVVV